MTPAERLVNHIREFLHGFDQEATPEAQEMSMQYSDLCHSLNDRLAKCVDFLRKGRRTEAVQAALTQPSVFELVETLDFDEAKNWLNLCLDLEMVPPPEIDFDAIDRLREECTTEQLMEPLLRQFRRLVHSGNRDERIHVLRRIRSHDEENPVWRENLEPLEQEQLVELRRLAGQRMAAGDFEGVLDIYTDMTAKHRVVEVPPEAVKEIESWLHKQREKNAAEEGQRLSEAIYEALEQRHFEGLHVLLQAWDRLARYPDFKPSAAMADAAAKANAWFQTEAKGRKRKKEFETDLRQLQALLKNPYPDQHRLEAQWDALQAYEEPLPDGLKPAVDEALDRLRKAVAARRRRRAVAVFVTVIVIAGGGAAGAFFGIRYHKTERTKRELSALWTAGRYRDLSQRLRQLEEAPWLYESAKAGMFVSKTNEKLAAEEARLQGLEKAIGALERVRAQQYENDPEVISALLDEARSYALTDDEKARLENWQQSWKAWRVGKQGRLDAEGIAAVERLERALKRAKERSDVPLSGRFQDLEALKRQSENVLSGIAETSAAVKERFRSVNLQLTHFARVLDREKAAEEAEERKYAAALAAIPKTAGNLEAWQQAIQQFIQSFPAAPETADLNVALDQFPAAQDAVMLANFTVTEIPETAAEIAEIEALIQRLPGNRDSVWRRDLLTLASQHAGDKAMRAALKRLEFVDFYNWKQVKIRKAGEEDWHVLYIPESGYFNSDKLAGKEGVMQYWGSFYGLKPDAGERVAKTFRWTTEEYEMEWPENPEEQFAPEAKFAQNVLNKVPDEKLFPFLLKTIDELKAQTDIQAIPKAIMLEIFGKALQEGLPMPAIGFEKYGQAFAGLNLNVPWENRDNEVVLTVKKDVEKRLSELPGTKIPLAILDYNRELLTLALSRGVTCVGLVWRDEQSGRLRPFLSRTGLKRLWTVLPAGQGVPNRFKQISAVDAEGSFSLPTVGADRVVPGQLLFAPSDKKTCGEILQDLSPVENRDAVRWPVCWPVNQRVLP